MTLCEPERIKASQTVMMISPARASDQVTICTNEGLVSHSKRVMVKYTQTNAEPRTKTCKVVSKPILT